MLLRINLEPFTRVVYVSRILCYQIKFPKLIRHDVFEKTKRRKSPPSPPRLLRNRERSKRLIIPYLSRSNVPDSGWHGIELPLRSSHTCRRLRRSPPRFVYVNVRLGEREREKGTLERKGGGRVRKSTIIPSFLNIYIYVSMPTAICSPIKRLQVAA